MIDGIFAQICKEDIMPFDIPEKSEMSPQESIDKFGAEKKLSDAKDIETRPGTFRPGGAELGGELRTHVEGAKSIRPMAVAELYRPDGSATAVGTAHFSVAGNEARVEGFNGDQHPAVTGAVLDEIGDVAREQGVNSLKVFVPDNDTDAAARWRSYGFHPTDRNPGAAGIDWEKPL
jgi:hypothetical protein